MTSVAAAPTAAAQNNSNQIGLVNVSLGDVALLNNVNLAVAANVAATICGVDVPVALLAQQVVAGTGTTVCDTAAGPLTVEQALNGGGPTGGGNNSQQTGLVNASLGDVAILNNVNLAVAANVAATICDVSVPVAILASQVFVDGTQAVCDTVAGPLTVDQAQSGPGGGPTGGGNNSQQTGLVNVSLGDVAILNNVNLAVAANVAATICDVSVPVAVLASQVFVDGTQTMCETAAGPLTVTQALSRPGGGGGPTGGGNNSQQEGLVNVSLGDLAILNNVNLAVAANVAATVCDVAIPIGVLAEQVFIDAADTICETAAGPLTVEQAQSGPGGGGGPTGGGNNSQQTGLVNVSLGDLAILNNVNLAVAANVAATVCDVKIPIAVLSRQVFVDGTETICQTAAGPLVVEQAQ